MKILILLFTICSFTFGQYATWKDKTAEELSGMTVGSTNLGSKDYWVTNAYGQIKTLFDMIEAGVAGAADTTALKLLPGDTSLTVTYLKQLSSANTLGGGYFAYIDSA